MAEENSKESTIYKFSIGEIDILPVEYFRDFLATVNAMAQVKTRELSGKRVEGLPYQRMAFLSSSIESCIKKDELTQASMHLRELYRILNF